MKHTKDQGTYRAATVESFNLSPYVGFPAQIERMPVLRCSACGAEVTPGEALERALDLTGEALMMTDGARLGAAQAVFLRKRMGLTQTELAARLGCDRQTVAKWETRGVPLSATFDLLLRSTYLASRGEALNAAGSAPRTRAAAERLLAALGSLGHVRAARASKRSAPVIVRASLAQLRAAG